MPLKKRRPSQYAMFVAEDLKEMSNGEQYPDISGVMGISSTEVPVVLKILVKDPSAFKNFDPCSLSAYN